MATTATLRLTLDLEQDAKPIAGTVTGPGDVERDFYGWTALASAIESAIEHSPDSAGRSVSAGRESK